MDTQNVLTGKSWTAKKAGNVYVVSINDKASIVCAFRDFVTQNKIKAGNITGIGAVNEVTLRYFKPETKEYEDKTFKEQMEITNLTGNISTKDGDPYLHLHITLGKADYTTYAGHLQDGYIRGAGEFYFEPIDTIVERTFSDEVGLNFYDFE